MTNYIFDIDGTLTPSRKQIDLGFEAFMIKFACLYPVYLVTGSNREKTIEQIGLDLYNSVNILHISFFKAITFLPLI